MGKFQEYLEAAKSGYMIDRTKGLKEKIKNFLNTTIGKLKGWKVIIVDESPDGEEPVVVPFDAKYFNSAKVGDTFITQKDYDQLKAGDMIHSHSVVDIDEDQHIVKIKTALNSRMKIMKKD